ncbi:MAG TPA: alpha/beta hydrolase [Candidatus Dormibacteraeota bacterium]|nr:alpha/beta hydrolase [Candidatus Dormibacteraeota bacterium]
MAEEPIDFRPLRVVHSVPWMEQVRRERDLVYKSLPAGTLLMDIYRPAPAAGGALPAVILVHGDGPPEWLKDIKDWGQYVSWGELLAASGLNAITFNHRSTEGWTRIAEAASDVEDLVALVRARANAWNVDPDRLAIWVASAGGFLGAHAALANRPSVRCLVIYYGMMAPAPLPGVNVEPFSPGHRLDKDGPPIFVARAGLDRPGLNETLDRFTDAAMKAGLDVELHNHAEGRHAFDVLDSGPRSREIIARSLEFLKSRLVP